MKIVLSEKEFEALRELGGAAKRLAVKFEDDTEFKMPKWISIVGCPYGINVTIKEEAVEAICSYMVSVYEGLGTVVIVLKTFVESVLMPKAVELSEILNNKKESKEDAA